jgi:hypothetical protein
LRHWPVLPAEALKRIEKIEEEAEGRIWDQVRAYTPGNPQWVRSWDETIAGGLRVIDCLCAFAATIFDASARDQRSAWKCIQAALPGHPQPSDAFSKMSFQLYSFCSATTSNTGGTWI